MEILERRGGTTPKSEIWLLDCAELSSDYANTWDFLNPAEQQKFFKSRVKSKFENYSYLRKEQAIKVATHIDDIHGVNYIMYANNANEYVYAFIIEKEYINENTTKIYIKTDLIQTYLFNIRIEDSYVDRCHVPRWSGNMPALEIENEGIEFGEYIQESSDDIFTFNESYIAVCSSPLGKMNYRKKTDPDVPSGGASGDWQNGIMSSDLFRYLKGFEAYARWPYDDGVGYMTIGYGITERFQKPYYDQLNKPDGCTEEEASKVMYERVNKDYAKPVVNKLKEYGITKQQQADALFSLSFNAGPGDVTGDNELTRVIKADPNNESAIRAVWETFRIRPGTPVEQGLRARRQAELNIYFNGVYEKRQIPKLNKSGKIDGHVTENNGNGWLPS